MDKRVELELQVEAVTTYLAELKESVLDQPQELLAAFVAKRKALQEEAQPLIDAIRDLLDAKAVAESTKEEDDQHEPSASEDENDEL